MDTSGPRTVKKQQRPVNLDLQTISFPITAIASILHRVSGVITFFAIAILLALLSQSLDSEQGFNNVMETLDHFLIKFVIWASLVALMYHLVGGVRHLIMDLGYWEELDTSAQSAKVSFIITGALALIMGVIVW
ncbi:succinate dehydrogenase cytochrome b556 subunit [Alginatibacterium sediminis]|uniref:Succinate dehydrogenase cytochrome b556 subunit n=1 Tax=Alginatibacterium sediminis TaxID=2164068 RepID=A0A420EFR9_9ALTE|nr:succinate dehydrogenase cytochrome b556 subunit [Alginatibacterium sediminis]RKF19518.1 succinate dehydrogenase cytochrome b556 subunit [Alginatibacterium sediminis]